MADDDDEFRVWAASQPPNKKFKGMSGVTLKNGPIKWKSAALSMFGPEDADEVHQVELRFRTAKKKAAGPGPDWNNPEITWHCENEEIDKLRFFLTESPDAGKYQLVNTTSPEAKVLTMLSEGHLTPEALVELLADHDRLADALARSEVGLTAAEAAVVLNRRNLVQALQELAATKGTTETKLHKKFDGEWWIFGGQYVGVADRKNLTMLDSLDIPLLTADGTLHVVELKGPDIPQLVHEHRNHPIVGNDVHEATAQAINYVRNLDETGAATSWVFENDKGKKYDVRRVFATVVIGHPDHNQTDYDEKQINQTIRSYNAHLSRVEVITYKQLFDAAERALEFEASPKVLSTQMPADAFAEPIVAVPAEPAEASDD